MTSTLHKLLRAGLLHPLDQLAFVFKKQTFAAQIVDGGLLSHCTWNGQPVLQDKVSFTTLTDWCDTCIQELADEYVTRFSSWKRVRHVKTGLTLSQVRAQLQSTDAEDDAPGKCRCQQLQKQVLQLQLQVKELTHHAQQNKRKAMAPLEDDNPFRVRF